MPNNILLGCSYNRGKVSGVSKLGNMINRGLPSNNVRAKNTLQNTMVNGPSVNALGMNLPNTSIKKGRCGCGK